MEPKRFDSDVSFNCIYAVDGNLVRADEHLAAIAVLVSEIERLQREVDEAEKARTICATCGEELTRMATP